MRAFFTDTDPRQRTEAHLSSPGSTEQPAADLFSARVASYDSEAAAPHVEDLLASDPSTLIETLSSKVYLVARDFGGPLPYTVIREVVENLIHADFNEIVVSILDSGHTLRFADQGPGISDKERALLPGFTTATRTMKAHIRGVGSGLPIVREFLSHQGGTLTIDDNLGAGTVITVMAAAEPTPESTSTFPTPERVPGSDAATLLLTAENTTPVPRLTTRHKKVLSLVLEFGEVGPTLVSKELKVGLSTAHRDLAYLEEQGLIAADESGKRELTDRGTTYLDRIFS
ncbi:MAG: ATP-binding protein [Desulfuromonadales bacterium]|nr:ATP-binding protein [Desulfuromonadales bacterium]